MIIYDTCVSIKIRNLEQIFVAIWVHKGLACYVGKD